MVLIIVSIFIAFALDRWWDAAREKAQERRYLHTLHQEFSGNKIALAQSLGRLAALDTAVAQILSLMGPQPQSISADSMAARYGGHRDQLDRHTSSLEELRPMAKFTMALPL
jgi:hypothetical protein